MTHRNLNRVIFIIKKIKIYFYRDYIVINLANQGSVFQIIVLYKEKANKSYNTKEFCFF